MSATDELRRMLDERGEYYQKSGNRTWWGRPIDARTGNPINVFHNQAQPMGDDRLFVELQLATPEQAIEATIGRTCKDANVAEYAWDDFECSECGWVTWSFFMEHEGCGSVCKPRYCPNCGAKVVE